MSDVMTKILAHRLTCGSAVIVEQPTEQKAIDLQALIVKSRVPNLCNAQVHREGRRVIVLRKDA